jgi:hypothetical protein
LEIEDAFLTRAAAIGEPSDVDDAEYQTGFRRAVYAAFDFTVSIIEREGETPPIPMALLSQARLAARNSVGLDTILRRYSAGSALLDGIVIREIDQQAWLGGLWQRLAYDRAAAFDFLISSITDEHRLGLASRRPSRLDRTLVAVKQILDGELPERFHLEYAFDASHIGLVARGAEAQSSLRALAQILDGRVLLVQPDDQSVWAWIGCREAIGRTQLAAALRASWPGHLPLGLGEPSSGIAGWRLSHRQASVALPITLHNTDSIAHYSDVCMQASVMRDDLLATSLYVMYVQPLLASRDGGTTYLHTLRAYFRADRNAASTASALGVSRQAVSNRLRGIEDLLGRPLSSCAVALELALHTAGRC